MFKKEKNKSEEINQYSSDANESKDNNMLLFLVGLALLAAGLFMLSKRTVVHSSWYGWRIGRFDLSSGTVVIPLLIGIIWYFFNSKSIFPKIIITLGLIFIVLSIIMSVRINFMATSLYDYILFLGMAAAGAGLLLRAVFKKKK